MECITENGIRYYITPEGRFPSVTSILSLLPKPALENWRTILGKEADKIAAERAVVGSVCHYRILSRYSIRLIEPPKVFLPWKDLEKWLKELNMRAEICEILWDELELEIEDAICEHTMISYKHRFAGTADLIGKVNGIPTILDIKTGNNIHREYFLQLAAYFLLANENEITIDRGAIVHLPVYSDELIGKVVWIKKEELSWFSAEFLNLVKEFYKSLPNRT